MGIPDAQEDGARTVALRVYGVFMDHLDPLDTQSQEHAQLEADGRKRFAEQMEVDDLGWLMGNKQGRRIVYRLLERAGVWRLTFSTDAMTMAFNEGNRNGGLMLLAQITAHCPEGFFAMLKEN